VNASLQTFPLYFPLFFVLLWFAVTVLLGFISGWYFLRRRFPDRPEAPLRTFNNQSGSIGFVGTRSLLTSSVCPGGLRVRIMRIFGPFSKDFFVPWSEMSVIRKDRLFWKVAKISLGNPPVGSLTLMADLADRLARAAGIPWPEPGPFPDETDTQVSSRIFKQWVAVTGMAAAFFIVAPRLGTPKGAPSPPILVAILFPAIVFGVIALVQYARRRRP
jgi:predicted permease